MAKEPATQPKVAAIDNADDNSGAPVLAQPPKFVPSPSTRPIPVVCAIIMDADRRVLLAQRPAHKHLGMKWEFAGGKVEPDEPPAAALVREIKEELACDVIIDRALLPFTHDYGSVVIEMIPFLCHLAPQSSAPHPHEHIALKWVTLAEIGDVDLAPADWPVVEMLRSVP